MIARPLVAGLALFLSVLTGGAGISSAQQGEVLTIEGLPGSASATFDLSDLKSLPVTEFETGTIWTDGVHRFTGVALSDLLAAVDAEGGTIRATATNDYAVDIPVSDAVPGGPMVAYLLDGNPMSARDKGPYWIVYPYDGNREYRSETIYSRSIWQVRRLDLRP